MEKTEAVQEIDNLVKAVRELQPYRMTGNDIVALKHAHAMITGILAGVAAYLEDEDLSVRIPQGRIDAMINAADRTDHGGFVREWLSDII